MPKSAKNPTGGAKNPAAEAAEGWAMNRAPIVSHLP
jgi:hypothetical protein